MAAAAEESIVARESHCRLRYRPQHHCHPGPRHRRHLLRAAVRSRNALPCAAPATPGLPSCCRVPLPAALPTPAPLPPGSATPAAPVARCRAKQKRAPCPALPPNMALALTNRGGPRRRCGDAGARRARGGNGPASARAIRDAGAAPCPALPPNMALALTNRGGPRRRCGDAGARRARVVCCPCGRRATSASQPASSRRRNASTLPGNGGREPPRHVRRLQFLERMGSCQVVHRGGTRRSCVSGRCGWSQRSAVSTIRSGHHRRAATRRCHRCRPLRRRFRPLRRYRRCRAATRRSRQRRRVPPPIPPATTAEQPRGVATGAARSAAGSARSADTAVAEQPRRSNASPSDANVDLPLPGAPTTARVSPARTDRLSSRTS